MTRPPARGHCPGAWRPMAANDGLVVRVRPRLARLTAAQALGLCELATRHGSGTVELTSRANLQLRGVDASRHDELLHALGGLGLLDADPRAEARRNVLVAPLWREGDATWRIADELTRRLDELPPLPPKFGYAVDVGDGRLLDRASADVRIERSDDGALMVRADGCATGWRATADDCVEMALSLARWFVTSGGAGSGRMADHVRRHAPPAASRCAPERHEFVQCKPGYTAHALHPGDGVVGPVLGAAFGSVAADDLASVVRRSGACAVRLTPWRLIVLEGGRRVDAPGLISRAGDPLLRVDACVGAPRCAAATVETRTLARELAQRWSAFAGRLHVSGCAKGCARPRAATVTLIGRDGRFDLVREGPPWAAPDSIDLDAAALDVEVMRSRVAGESR